MGYNRAENVICLALGSTWTDCSWKNILFSRCGQGDTRELWDPVGEVDRMGDPFRAHAGYEGAFMDNQEKVQWLGKILSIQPRTNVWRYVLDNRTHSHIGYNLFLDGSVNGINAQFAVAISEKQQQCGGFRIGDFVKGTAWTKKYPGWEYADYYRAGALKRISEGEETTEDTSAPPWRTAPPDMQTYEWRGARMLSLSCWKGKCFQCIWANMANVTIEYEWGKSQKHRFESFCYGPKSCKVYKMGKPRNVPYKGRGSNYDEGWLDDICTERRGEDD